MAHSGTGTSSDVVRKCSPCKGKSINSKKSSKNANQMLLPCGRLCLSVFFCLFPSAASVLSLRQDSREGPLLRPLFLCEPVCGHKGRFYRAKESFCGVTERRSEVAGRCRKSLFRVLSCAMRQKFCPRLKKTRNLCHTNPAFLNKGQAANGHYAVFY